MADHRPGNRIDFLRLFLGSKFSLRLCRELKSSTFSDDTTLCLILNVLLMEKLLDCER